MFTIKLGSKPLLRACAFMLLILTPTFSLAQLQQRPIPNGMELNKYFEPKSITKLDWELMTFNLWWQGAFEGDTDYVTSFPVVFDVRLMRFTTTFRVSEKRNFTDPESFFRLPRARREAILQNCVNHLQSSLAIPFPEVKANPRLIYAEFQFFISGGSSLIARYENGIMTLIE